jgi:hypothetical protein
MPFSASTRRLMRCARASSGTMKRSSASLSTGAPGKKLPADVKNTESKLSVISPRRPVACAPASPLFLVLFAIF